MEKISQHAGIILRKFKKREKELQDKMGSRAPILFPDRNLVIEILINTLSGLILNEKGEPIHLTTEQADRHYLQLISLVKTYMKCRKCSVTTPNALDLKKCSGKFLHKIDEDGNVYHALCQLFNTKWGVEPLIIGMGIQDDFGILLLKQFVGRK